MMQKNYQALVNGRIFFGGAADVEAAVMNEKVDVVIDLRVKEPEAVTYNRVHAPIADEAEQVEASIQHAVDEVLSAYHNGKKVFFHCGGGGGRAGTVAVGALMELGQAKSVEEAEQQAKTIREKVNVREPMKKALQNIYEK
ncbi:dual specificity protein phosphatase family protein [Viridibacillus sp. YIM B01967]|uniref:Dual specificity protein phosphatase family protein n=1 Tax=Viridibacillus soli TaxID=2798301 RepID=A0ABS1HD93_9BACL|nr:dual specificity protein phosphatase family protein [Viridibacillus soli]MBK3497438.1 dual specificity protein phosphatase family protein [Viridibacillus soli]